MSESVRQLLTLFDTLPDRDKQAAVVEILRRTSAEGDLAEAGLHELADELFQALDTEEADRAGR